MWKLLCIIIIFIYLINLIIHHIYLLDGLCILKYNNLHGISFVGINSSIIKELFLTMVNIAEIHSEDFIEVGVSPIFHTFG